jgi:uncharacterized protein
VSLPRRTVLAAPVAAALAACSADPPTPPAAPTASSPPTGAPAPASTPTADPLPAVTDPQSLPALMRRPPDAGRVRVTRTELETDAYRRQQVTYRSDDTTVSGVLLRPRGAGPFPAIVLNHGYIEPSVYVTGQGLAREQDALARAGWVVLHTDYRGHAASDPAGDLERELRLGYTRDSVNAVAALKRLPYVDPDRTAMLGRSMGGGVTMNALVTQPGLVKAAVVYDSVSSRFAENLDHFTRPNRPEVASRLERRGSAFLDGLSPRTYFDRITEPVLVHHGTADATCPPRWAHATQRAMEQAGVDSRLRWWPGEDHAFYARWDDAMRVTLAFLDRVVTV